MMSEPTAASSAAAVSAAPAPPRGAARRAPLLVVVLLFLAGGTYWWLHRGIESTDDAQVDADVVPVPARIGGIVAEVSFEENQPVHAGQVLAKLDDAQAKARVAQCEAALQAARAAADAAEADADISSTNASSNRALASAGLQTASEGSTTADNQIAEAQAALAGASAAFEQAERERDRVQGLFSSGAVAQSALDQVITAYHLADSNLRAAEARLTTLRTSALQARSRIKEATARVAQTADVAVIVRQARARAKVAQAQVETAKVALEMARLDLSYTQVIAPADGIASKKSIVVGQSVAAGQAVSQLVTAKRWVTANFKETQLQDMRAGQRVTVKVDAFPDHPLVGRVESFAGGTGSRFALLPPDNASGNFTKVVQRVPVRIALTSIPGDVALRPGMNVELSIDTRGSADVADISPAGKRASN